MRIAVTFTVSSGRSQVVAVQTHTQVTFSGNLFVTEYYATFDVEYKILKINQSLIFYKTHV